MVFHLFNLSKLNIFLGRDEKAVVMEETKEFSLNDFYVCFR